MRITGNNISEELKHYMQHSLRTALGDATGRVVAIEVELSGVDGRPASGDSVCGMRVQLRRAGVVFVHGRGNDPHVAVDRAGIRLKTALTTWPVSRTHGRFDHAS
jgi:hypothetical protein